MLAEGVLDVDERGVVLAEGVLDVDERGAVLAEGVLDVDERDVVLAKRALNVAKDVVNVVDVIAQAAYRTVAFRRGVHWHTLRLRGTGRYR